MESNNTIRINTCERAHVVQTHKYMDTVGQRESLCHRDGTRWQAASVLLPHSEAPRARACSSVVETHQRWLSQGFGRAPHVVSWMVAPSLRSTNKYRGLLLSGAVSKSSTLFFFLLFWSKPRANPFLFLLGVLCMLKTSDLNGLTSKEDCWWFVRWLFFLHSNILMWENDSLIALIWYGKCHCLR